MRKALYVVARGIATVGEDQVEDRILPEAAPNGKQGIRTNQALREMASVSQPSILPRRNDPKSTNSSATPQPNITAPRMPCTNVMYATAGSLKPKQAPKAARLLRSARNDRPLVTRVGVIARPSGRGNLGFGTALHESRDCFAPLAMTFFAEHA